MKKFNVTIPIKPVTKARPRVLRKGWAYTPKKTLDYEKAIAEYWRQATHDFQYSREQAIVVNLSFGLPIPKNTSKKKTALMDAGNIPHIKKPDADNLAKAVMDALNKVAWVDDSQVIKVSIHKKYSKEPYVYIYIHDEVE